MKSFAIPMCPEIKCLGDDYSLFLIDGEPFSILMDVRNIRIASLNRGGQAILPELLRFGLDTAVSQLVERYGLDVATVRRDVEQFADELEKQGFLPWIQPKRRSLAQLVRRKLFKQIVDFVLRSKVQGYYTRKNKSPFSRYYKDDLRRLVRSLLGWGWWSMRVLGWAGTLETWKHDVAPTVVLLPVQDRLDAMSTVDQLVREEVAARLLLPCACKDRALIAAYCLRQLGGLKADIVFGIIPVPFQVHAWCICEGHVLTDDPDHIALYRPVIRFPLA
jgi:hypothetical protein